MRGSDPDAAMYWLARMLDGGEDPLYVARRLVRFANEDIGMADPYAVQQALAAWDVYERLGSPEGELAIAQAVVYLATAQRVLSRKGLKRDRLVQQQRDERAAVHRYSRPARVGCERVYGTRSAAAHTDRSR